MIPDDFVALVASQPMRRTRRGAQVATVSALDFPEQHLALLRRFTGETLLDYLLPVGESKEAAREVAFALYRQGLIVPAEEPRPTCW